MNASAQDRINVTASARELGVSIMIGDTLIALTLPAPGDVQSQDAAAVRATALRLAARALDVAQEEVRQAQGEGRVSGRAA